MRVVNQKNGHHQLYPEGKETPEDIAVAVIMCSYEQASPFGYGFMQPHESPLTREQAQAMLRGEQVTRDYLSNTNAPNDVYMDYVNGRCCKTKVRVYEDRVETYISPVDRKPNQIIAAARKVVKDVQRDTA